MLKIYVRALKLLQAEGPMLWLLIAAGVVTAVIQLLEPVWFGQVIDTLGAGESSYAVLIVWAALGLFNVLVSVFLAVNADRVAHRQRLEIMGEAFERAIGLPVSYHAEQGSGRVVRAILSGSDQLFALWLSFIREHFPALIGIMTLVPAAIKMDWRLASLLFTLGIVYVIGNRFILRRTQGGQMHVEGYHQDLFGRVGDVIGNVTVVQSYTRLADEAQALQQIMARLLNAQYPVLTWWGLLTVITRVAATLTMVCILGLGSYFAARGEITAGEIVAFVGFSGLLIAKLDQISAFFSRLVTQAPTLKTLFDLLDRDGAAIDRPGATPIAHVHGEIAFENVTFHYPGKTHGVHDLNFHVPAGHTVALVGPSGSGKTTSLALLQRLFDPQDGRILLDGRDIRDVTLFSLRHAIAAVFQDSGLFNRSIAENIRVGRPSATDAEVEEAARQARAYDFIMAKNGGFGFVIGERGSLLSGGERQRLAIARAILKNAPVLILDEATSALDNETERHIQAALANLRAGKTSFIIAHRLSTVVNADRILVFDNGRIVESGTFQELKAQGRAFAKLLAAGAIEPLKRESEAAT